MRPTRLSGVPRGRAVGIHCEGEPVRAFDRETVAVGLFASGREVLSRSLKYHRPRSFFCLDGHCSGCLMRIDGVPNVRACMVPCREGQVVEGQNAYPTPKRDLLGVVDWVFARGMDHHTLMTGSKVLNRITGAVVRKLSGLGTLPEGDSLGPTKHERVDVDVLVVGGGPAGLLAATAAAKSGARTLLADEQAELGGTLRSDPRVPRGEIERRVALAEQAGCTLRSSTVAIGYFPEDDNTVVLVGGATLTRVNARAVVYATGGYAQNLPFADNDRPGVVAARAAGLLLLRHGVLIGSRVCLLSSLGDQADDARALAGALEASGCAVTWIDPTRETVLGTRGRTWVQGLEVRGEDGTTRVVPCDAVVIAAPPSPASEAPRQHGCEVELSTEAGGFAVKVDADGQTTVAGVYACGDVCGAMRQSDAAARAERCGTRAAAFALAAPAVRAPARAKPSARLEVPPSNQPAVKARPHDGEDHSP